MKKIPLFAMMLALVLVLSACGCKHETWLAADCVTPKTCAQCGETEGEALGHTWADPACETPKTCTLCGETEGAALGHSWTEADCINPKNCQTCKLTEGEPLGHSWTEATTEAPMTCTACGETQGERIVTDSRFTTANNQQLFGLWKTEIRETLPETDVELVIYMSMEFFNDGTMNITMEIADPEAYLEAMIQASVESTYAMMEADGYDRAEADEYYKESTGMGVEEYYTEVMSSVDLNEMMGMLDAFSYVYYAEGDQLYRGISWKMDMTNVKFRVEDGVLYIFDNPTIAVPTAFHKVEESQT